jgi:CheY-like chemotaxis protein
MMRILFLDDNPNRHNTMQANSMGAVVDHVYSAAEAIDHLSREEYDLIMLDHDLSEDPDMVLSTPDGSYVAEYMAQHLVQHSDTPVVIHSLNPPGSQNMMNMLLNGGYSDVRIVPFAWRKITIENGDIHFIL